MRYLNLIIDIVGAFWILVTFLITVGIVTFVRSERRARKVQ